MKFSGGKLMATVMTLLVFILTACTPNKAGKNSSGAGDADISEWSPDVFLQQKAGEFRNRLSLAEEEGDLDQMYLALLNLSDLGVESPALRLKLENVEDALDLMQQIKRSEAGGRYAEVIEYADLLLVMFPGHAETIRNKYEAIAFLEERRKRDGVIQAKLESAISKGEVKKIVMILQSLDQLTVEQVKLLEKAKNAITLLEKIQIAREKHLHEQVVWLADEMLTSFPENAEAVEYIKLSGLIFINMEEALLLLKECYPENGFDDSVEPGLYLGYGDIFLLDYAVLQQKMAEVESLVMKALELDPAFAHVILLDDHVHRMKNLLSTFAATTFLHEFRDVVESGVFAYTKILGYLESTKEDGMSIEQFWDTFELHRINILNTAALKFDELDELLAALEGLRTEDNKALIDAMQPVLQPSKDAMQVILTRQDEIEVYRQKGYEAQMKILGVMLDLSNISDAIQVGSLDRDNRLIVQTANSFKYFAYDFTPEILKKYQDLIQGE